MYEWIRKPLKVPSSKDLTEALAEVKLPLSSRKELLGDERSRVKPEEWTEEEQKKLAEAEEKLRTEQINERVAGALSALEEVHPGATAVFVTGGTGYQRDGESKIIEVSAEKLGDAARPYAWPLAHNVRPARQSLGASGCIECHSNGSQFFNAEVQPIGLLPNQKTKPVKTHVLQNADMQRLTTWNQLFQGRSVFKIFGLVALGLTCVVALSACAINLLGHWRR